MDKQTIFNQVLTGMRAQGRLGEGLYYGQQDPTVRCAIGMLIPPDQYTANLEHMDSLDVLVSTGFLSEEEEENEEDSDMFFFLNDIQMNHDCANDFQSFENRMELLAVEWKLNYE